MQNADADHFKMSFIFLKISADQRRVSDKLPSPVYIGLVMPKSWLRKRSLSQEKTCVSDLEETQIKTQTCEISFWRHLMVKIVFFFEIKVIILPNSGCTSPRYVNTFFYISSQSKSLVISNHWLVSNQGWCNFDSDFLSMLA